MRRRLVALLVPLLAAISGALSCSDDEEPWYSPPIEGAATISGVVSGAQGPFSAVGVTAFGVGGSARAGETTVWTDSTGRYALPVTGGEYVVGIGGMCWYSRHGLVRVSAGSLAGADTIRLDSGADFRAADFTFGGARVVLRCPATISGRLVEIRIRDCGASGVDAFGWESNTRIDGDSAVSRIDWILPGVGSLCVEARLPGISAEWLRVAPEEAGAPDTFRCRPGAWTELSRVLPGLAEVTIRVRGSWEALAASGLGVSPEFLAFGDDSTRAVFQEGIVDSAGAISMTLLAREGLRFAVRIGGVMSWIGGDSFDRATRYDVGPGELLELPEVQESGLLCRLDPDWGDPRILGEIILETPSGRALDRMSVTSNYVGWANLDPGPYFLHYDPDRRQCSSSWLARWYPDARTRETAVPVLVEGAGSLTRIEWRLTSSGGLAGVIAELPGAPSGREATLLLFEGGDSTRVWCSQSGVYGTRTRFAFRGVEDGAFGLAVRLNLPGGPRLWWYPGTWLAREAEMLTVQDHAQVRDLDWEWPR